MRHRSVCQDRRGAVLVEGAIVYPVFLMLIFMLIIGGMGVFRYQQVACLAREAARYAAVHGSGWHKETGQTCPTSSAIQNAVLPLAVGMDPNKLSMQVQWVGQVSGTVQSWDSVSKHALSVNTSNQGVVNRVRVTVTYQWTPQLYLVGSINLQSTCEIPMSL
ncbi:MAG TPA: TadE/TadG family type IV pilus assembly protein [Gemmataceae bacterium]|nr:TadE/TadG family type IV pilus assembly protein [Gemmataceae bacterium]